MTKNIIAVAGPTASGKTALAARLALEIGGEVISNDSMQIYKGMEIGCATPTAEEMLGVPHHLLSFMSPTDDFSCADYGTLAKAKAEARAAEAKKKKVGRAVKSVANSAVGTIGRQLGNEIGQSIGGSFGKKLGGNVGASLGRGILSTLFKY